MMIGPWRHQEPSSATPGPRIEWKYEAVRWFDMFLKPTDHYNTGILEEDDINIYIRDYYEPNQTITNIPGQWKTFSNWPLNQTQTKVCYIFDFIINILSNYIQHF